MELKCLNHMLYWVYAPENPQPGLPLMVFLHGAAERGDDGQAVLVRAVPKMIAEGRWQPRAYVICPQCKPCWDWNSQVERVKAIIDHEARQLQADPTRISITGISMGGFGTWAVGIHFPEFFSAMAPICGGGLAWRGPALAESQMPIWAFHGDADTVVPVRNSVDMVESVNAAGGNAKLTILPGVAHNCWDTAYEQTQLLQWLLEQRREQPVDRPYFANR